jgi:hypothetical protein
MSGRIILLDQFIGRTMKDVKVFGILEVTIISQRPFKAD